VETMMLSMMQMEQKYDMTCFNYSDFIKNEYECYTINGELFLNEEDAKWYYYHSTKTLLDLREER
jgi:hypothetical protein